MARKLHVQYSGPPRFITRVEPKPLAFDERAEREEIFRPRRHHPANLRRTPPPDPRRTLLQPKLVIRTKFTVTENDFGKETVKKCPRAARKRNNPGALRIAPFLPRFCLGRARKGASLYTSPEFVLRVRCPSRYSRAEPRQMCIQYRSHTLGVPGWTGTDNDMP